MSRSGSKSIQLHFCMGEYNGHVDHACFKALKKIRLQRDVHTSRIILTTDWICNRLGQSSFRFLRNALQESSFSSKDLQAGAVVLCKTRYPTHPRSFQGRNSRFAGQNDSSIRESWRRNFVNLHNWCMQNPGTSWNGHCGTGLYVVLEVTMAPRLEAINTVCKSVLQNKPYVYMYLRKRTRQFDLYSQVPRSMLCCTSCEAIHFMVTCIKSSEHITFRFEPTIFRTELCREAASLPLPLTLWARVSTFCLSTPELIVMKLHEFLFAAYSRAHHEFLLAARAAAYDERCCLAAFAEFMIGASRNSSPSP
jgi:hypothetical protein